ncbi:hypothetical protein [Pseudomonas tohonis]|uniref:hypothetical protein n=1 Tax=Pseudomonas tohonis TaxID=2725477 RepID=UPI0022EFEE75|nr:hypothetical protein [Pseudomonas tohonis]
MERYRRLASFAPHLVLLACAVLANPAQARDPQPCSAPLVKALAKQLGQSGWTAPESDGEGPLVAAACKPWPDDKAQSVVALAYVRPGDEGVAQGERSLALLVAKVDGRSGALLERYDSTLDEDAATEVSGDSLWLDTARYHLAPGVRAFGLVFDSTARGASCPDGGSDEELTLFAPAGKALRPVLKAYLSEWTTIKGTLCVNDPDFMTERQGHPRPRQDEQQRLRRPGPGRQGDRRLGRRGEIPAYRAQDPQVRRQAVPARNLPAFLGAARHPLAMNPPIARATGEERAGDGSWQFCLWRQARAFR